MKIGIIGAGPAGLSLARLLNESGFQVTVYEVQSELAVKPCGWGFPHISGEDSSLLKPFIKDLEDSIVWEYSGYRVYLDGSLLFENKKRKVLGYIIDKKLFLKKLSEGIDLRLRSRARYVSENMIEANGLRTKYDVVVNAGGFYNQKKDLEKIPAIQYHLEGSFEEPEIPELYFDSNLVGYTWFFPENKRRARIGIGGYASVGILEEMLRKLIISKNQFRNSLIIRREGAYVTVNGIDHDLVKDKDPYHIGEALGAVMPATGEGIRPSIYTSIALYKSLKSGTDYLSELKKLDIFNAIDLQKKILDIEIKIDPNLRRQFLMKTPEDLLIKISLGMITKKDLLSLAIRRDSLKILLESFADKFTK